MSNRATRTLARAARWTLLAGLAAAFGAAVMPPHVEAAEIGVRGTVAVADTDAPLAGVHVRVIDTATRLEVGSDVTDVSGDFFVPVANDTGRYIVEQTRPAGFTPAAGPVARVEVDLSLSGGLANVAFREVPPLPSSGPILGLLAGLAAGGQARSNVPLMV